MERISALPRAGLKVAASGDASQLFAQFDIDKDPARMGELRQILDANDPT